MSLALDLARNGRGSVEPNPMVGAVLARDGRELARGWHRRFGGPHAEVEALAAARGAGIDPAGATLYVTLEPCCHHGKTPPCTDALIAAKVARVVAAMEDPDAKVAGKGLATLRQAGIEVTVGPCSQAARTLLAPYIKLRTRRRPWVICKWAQTVEGLLALPRGTGRWISGEQSRQYVHHLRGLCQGICVGAGTVLADDPLLNNRGGSGGQPLRIVLDARLRTPPHCQLLATARQWPVLIATVAGKDKASTAAKTAAVAPDSAAASLRQAGAEILELPTEVAGSDEPRVSLSALLDALGQREHTYLLVEGGAAVLNSFIRQNLADEFQVFVCPSAGAFDDPALPRLDIAQLRRELAIEPAEEQTFGPDRWQRYVLGRQ